MSEDYCVGCNVGAEKLVVNSGEISCNDTSGNCGDCCTAFKDPTRRTRFGITLEQAYCHCRDICVQEVRAICAQPIDFYVDIPTGVGSQNCRLEYTSAAPPFTDCQIIVKCASESLKADCSGVDITVGFQIILTCVNVIPPTKLIINYYKNFSCSTFYVFPEGTQVSNVPELLKIIDGSCLVIQDLQCAIVDSGNPRVHVTGKLVDKLWKEENLWIQALRPYSGVSTKREFPEPHKIGECPR